MIHQYKLGGHNIVLDIASGTVHSVDDVVYDAIRCYGDAVKSVAPGKAVAPEVIKNTAEIHPNVAQADIRAIVDDIEKLVNAGKLFTQDTFEPIAGTAEESHAFELKALCLNVSHNCNMDCAYCFAAQSINKADKALMTFETGKQAIDFLVENSGIHNQLDVDFFGGEPLLNWQCVKEIVAYARMAGKFTGKKFRFTLTTNGLLIDDDVIAFTNREFHNVVLSIDGRPEVHNKMRKLPDGSDSYDTVVKNIRRLVTARREQGYYIRGTFTKENIDFVNDILHLADELGFMQISLEPAVAKRDDPSGFTKDDLPELFRQYDVLAIEMQRRKDNAKYLNARDLLTGDRLFSFYHYNLDLCAGPCIYKRIKGCGVGREYLAVTPAGELYPCHQFIGDNSFILGNVQDGINKRGLQNEFAAVNIYSREQCRACWARFYCSGGCVANAYHDTGSINGIYEIGCELFKKRIENAIMLQF